MCQCGFREVSDDDFTSVPRGPNGRFPKGTSGNPGGMSKSKRRRRREALELHDKALQLAREMLADHEANPKVMRMGKGGVPVEEWNISPSDLRGFIDTMAKHGGVLTKEQEARLLIAIAGLRSSFKTEEEFQDFLAIASGRKRIQAPSKKQIMPADPSSPRERGNDVSCGEAGTIKANDE